MTDDLSRTTSFEFDDAGRLERTVLPGSREIAYTWDDNGNLASLTPPGQPAHEFRYTLLDQEEEYEPPAVDASNPRTVFTYNPDRDLKRIDRPDESSVVLGYDTAGRLETVTTSRGLLTLSYEPETETDPETGQVFSISAPDGEGLAFTYDGFLPKRTTWSGSASGYVEHGFDSDFRVSTQNVNGSSSVSFGYDNDSLLTSAGSETLTRHAQTGLITDTSLGVVATSTGYNGFGESTSETATINGSNVFDTTFTRDDLGRITQKVETVQGTTTTYDYRYDLADRLDQVQHNGTVVRTYSYDSNGNRLSVVDRANTTAGTYDDQDRLITYGATTYVHDAAGDLTSKTGAGGTTEYTYDELGNLTQVTLPNSTVITYPIDGQNRRIGKRVNGTLVKGWLYQNQLEPVAEIDSSGAVVSRFVYGSKANVPDYMVQGGTTYRILSDHLGSVRLVVNTSTGAVAQRIDYDEFGNITNDTNPGFQPFGFAGGLYDADTGLTRFGARDYDAQIGRWTTKDPIRFDGGLNLFGYAFNDPVNLIDPSGLVPPSVQHPSANICSSIAAASSMSHLDFYSAVKSFGPWDWKNQPGGVAGQSYQDFGNYHYGVVSQAAGYSSGFAQRGAGAYQIWSGTSRHRNPTVVPGRPGTGFSQGDDFGWPIGAAPYGDDPRDNYWIQQGINDFNSGYWSGQCGCGAQ